MSRHTPRGATYRRLAAQVKRDEPYCWLCHKPIDPTLGRYDPGSFQLDHVIPASRAPELALLRENAHASHRRCNGKRGDRAPSKVRAALTVVNDW